MTFGPALAPTRRLFIWAAICPLFALALIVIDLDLWKIGLAAVASLLFLTLFDARIGLRARDPRIRVQTPGALHVGDTGTLALEITVGPSAAGSRIEALVDLDPKIEPCQPVRMTVDRDGVAANELTLRPLRRGDAGVTCIWLRWPGPLGLTLRVRREPMNISVPILPNLPAVRRAALQIEQRGGRAGQKPQLVRSAGSEFEALRDFVSGHDRRDIDWKHTARHRKLISKEYRLEQNHLVLLAIDCGHVMREPIDGLPKVDRAINAALIVAHQALIDGDRVGVFGFAGKPKTYLPPVAGVRNFIQIQHSLSSLDYSFEEPNYTLSMSQLMTRVKEPAIIIVFADFLGSTSAEMMIESLAHVARRHTLLFITLQDPELDGVAAARPTSDGDLIRTVVASDMLRDRKEVLERLRRVRIDAFDVDPMRMDAAVISRYFRAKETAMAVPR